MWELLGPIEREGIVWYNIQAFVVTRLGEMNMADSNSKPVLRQLDGYPIEAEGQTMFCLRDPEGYAPNSVVLTPAAFFLVTLFNGENDVRDIQTACMRQFGQLVPSESIEKLIRTLDTAYMIENDRFAVKCAEVIEEFGRRDTIAASHAGSAYADKPDALRDQLRGFFVAADGPGMPDESVNKNGVCGVIAPHIDIERGGVTYAHAYREIIERCPADTVVVLGTCHLPTDQPFAVTRKGFATPLGDVATDTELIDRLADRVGHTVFDGEIAFRTEHTIEFQAVYLKFAFERTRDIRLVPILCSTCPALDEDASAAKMAEPFLDELARIVSDLGERVAVIASADFSHVGPRFGDPKPVSASGLISLKSADLETLAAIETGSSETFIDDARVYGVHRHVCGIPPIYAMLEVLPPSRGRLLHYAQWPDPQAVVTFAAMAFDRQD